MATVHGLRADATDLDADSRLEAEDGRTKYQVSIKYPRRSRTWSRCSAPRRLTVEERIVTELRILD